MAATKLKLLESGIDCEGLNYRLYQGRKYKTFKGANKWLSDNGYKLVSED